MRGFDTILQQRSTYAINPLRIEQGLVVVRRLVVPLPLHVKEVTSLQRNRTNTADFIGTDGTCQRDLACHGGTADDRRLQAELLDHSGDAANVGVFIVSVRARVVALVLRSVLIDVCSKATDCRVD